MSEELAIVLVSGGLDSCVAASIARVSCRRLAFLHVNYGQRTEERELRAFNDIADHYSVGGDYRLVTDISYLSAIGGSSLTDKGMKVENANTGGGCMPNTYVPFRNTHLLSIAVSWAEVILAGKIFIGAVAQDTPGYPDCDPAYYDAFNRLVAVGAGQSTQITVVTPVIGMDKAEIVRRGLSLGAPLHATWSCYKNSDLACGECSSCALRLDAFRKAGVDDPVRYKAAAGKMRGQDDQPVTI